MSSTKLIQYTHRPNATELGMGNTHETYMLINSDKDLSAIFPPSIDVKVRESDSGKNYFLKSANGKEFRVNQMGELYRDYNVRPGDEIVITKIETSFGSDVCVSVRQYDRVVLIVNANGVEVVNVERLEGYLSGIRTYKVDIYDRGNCNTLVITFKEAQKKRKDSPNTTDYYEAIINGQKLANGTYYLTLGESSTLSMLQKSEYNTVVFNEGIFKGLTPNVKKTDEVDSVYNIYLTAIRTKPFILLAGISGTGKSRIVRKLAQATDDIDTFINDDDRWKLQRPANFELIQVKPNWHNSMDVVGFKSNINGEHYEFTPFVDFIVKAWCHQNTPFFLCLDEMNLAPVEEYFAEFLSAIESRAIGEDGEFETDPIIKPFDSFGTELSGAMMHHFVEMDYDIPKDVENRLRKKGLTLPKNLIVMGTVNMDETTFSFSRKVLDRAMSIEMNEVDYDGFIEGRTEYSIPRLVESNDLLVNRPVSAQDVKVEIEAQTVMDFLKAVNELLDGTPFKLGYRAANEAVLYVAADKAIGADNVKAALDDFTLMKILSRIEGDDSKLVTKDGDKLLDKLYDLLNSVDVFGTLENSKSLAKLDNMRNTLKRDHFVSFWG